MSNDFTTNTSDNIPWGKIQGMRNRFAHDYGSADDVIIWNTVTTEIPILRSFCEQQVKSYGQYVQMADKLKESYDILEANPQLKRRFNELADEYSKKYGVSVSDSDPDVEKCFKVRSKIVCSDPAFNADYIKARDDFRHNKRNIEQNSQIFPKPKPPKHGRR